MARKTSVKRRLDTIRKNKKKVRDAINTLPRRAPPTLGLLGQAYNLLRTAPEPLIDAASLAFSPEAILIGANEFERRLTNDENSSVSRLTSMDDIEKLIQAAGDEEFLDSNLVMQLFVTYKLEEKLFVDQVNLIYKTYFRGLKNQ